MEQLLDVNVVGLLENEKGRSWRIEEREGRGRCLVANRQLEVGEIVIEEKPAVWGPKQMSSTSCLGCYDKLMFDCVFFCSKCGLPLCSDSCPKLINHRPECEMLSPARDIIILNSEIDLQQVYYFVTVLRALWLRENNNKQWEAVKLLMSNLEKRRGTKIFDFNQTYVVETLQHFGIRDFTEDQIQEICGIFDSNAYESSGPSRVSCRGLYLIASMMNSSCLPNTRHFFRDSGEMVLVCTRPVYQGAEILGCYTQPRWATTPRQKHLLTTKFFRCKCARCEDPEECGTYSGALLCPTPDCRNPVCPRYPGEANQDWICIKCKTHVPSRKCLTSLAVGTQLVHTRDRSDQKQLIQLIQKLEGWLYPTHYTVSELKMACITEWGDPNFVPFKDVDEIELKLKIKFSVEMMKSVEIIEGEQSRSKGFIIYNLLKTLDHCKTMEIAVDKDILKLVPQLTREIKIIFKDDCGSPVDYCSFIH